MTNFQFPADGSVVIIDDKIKDALPLIQFLSRQGIASTYYSGNDNELPDPPCQKIRYAFVDIQLFPAGDSLSYAQNIKRLLHQIVPVNNGPYVLIIWSTVELVHAETLESEVTDMGFEKRPVAVVRLHKSSLFTTIQDNSLQEQLLEDIDANLAIRFSDDDVDAIKEFVLARIPSEEVKQWQPDVQSVIDNALNDKLKNINSFKLFVEWESLISKASGEIVYSYSQLHKLDKHWEDNLKCSIYRMSHAQLGKTVDTVSEEDLLKSALKTLNHTFLDVVENKISESIVLKTSYIVNRNSISFIEELGTDIYKINWKANNKYQFYKNGVIVPAGHRGYDSIEKLAFGLRNQPDIVNITKVIENYESIKPEINNRLLVEFNTKNSIHPGNVYEINVQNWKKRQSLLKTYMKKDSTVFFNANGHYIISNSELKKIKFIELEVTPLCDFVQEKWKKSRRLPGILVPQQYSNHLQSPDSFYSQIPLLRIDGVSYKPVFDFRLLKSIDIETNKNNLKRPLFRTRGELFADVLSRLSSHASRVGISFIE